MTDGPKGKGTSKHNFLSGDEIERRIREHYSKHGIAPPSGYVASANDVQQAKKQEALLTPKEIKTYLDKYVISQERAKKDISVAVSFHYSRISNTSVTKKNNILMIGPSGVGKTYTLQKIAGILNVPLVEVDVTKITKTGYVGMCTDDILKYVLQKSDNNPELAQKAIVYIDEIDKIRTQNVSGGGRDITGHDVQTELLKMLEGAEIPLSYEHGQKIYPFNTKNILFVCSGAFPELEEIISSRTSKPKTIGFSNSAFGEKKSSVHAFESVTVEDLVKYGFLPEFLGRLPVITVLSPLGIGELKRILIEPEDSLLKQYKNELKSFGIELDFADDALDVICEKAYNHGTGARALNTVCEEILKEFKYELPGSNIKKLVVTKEIVANPKAELERMISAK